MKKFTILSLIFFFSCIVISPLRAMDQFGLTFDQKCLILAETKALAQKSLESDLLDTCRRGDPARLKQLLKAGISPNVVDQEGFSALTLAVYYNFPVCVRHLIAYKVKLNWTDQHGRSALHWAARKGFIDMILLLCQMGANLSALHSPKLKDSPLLLAAFFGHAHCVQFFLNEGISPDLQNRDGMTPLMAAAEQGHKKVVELLLDRGADWQLKNLHEGKIITALDFAQKHGHQEIVGLLQKPKSILNEFAKE